VLGLVIEVEADDDDAKDGDGKKTDRKAKLYTLAADVDLAALD
jgi:hypothetical protein